MVYRYTRWMLDLEKRSSPSFHVLWEVGADGALVLTRGPPGVRSLIVHRSGCTQRCSLRSNAGDATAWFAQPYPALSRDTDVSIALHGGVKTCRVIRDCNIASNVHCYVAGSVSRHSRHSRSRWYEAPVHAHLSSSHALSFLSPFFGTLSKFAVIGLFLLRTRMVFDVFLAWET